MDNEAFIKKIMAMDEWELLEMIIVDPALMTDPYYRIFEKVIVKRFYELKEAK